MRTKPALRATVTLTIRGGLPYAQRQEVASWLVRQATALAVLRKRHSAKRYVARYEVRW